MKNKKSNDISCPCDISADTANNGRKKKNADEKIYNFFDRAEKIARLAVRLKNRKNRKAKKQKKNDKKVCKLNKKTGVCNLKKIKKEKPLKRYKPSKNK